jgi:hypothetical protein
LRGLQGFITESLWVALASFCKVDNLLSNRLTGRVGGPAGALEARGERQWRLPVALKSGKLEQCNLLCRYCSSGYPLLRPASPRGFSFARHPDMFSLCSGGVVRNLQTFSRTGRWRGRHRGRSGGCRGLPAGPGHIPSRKTGPKERIRLSQETRIVEDRLDSRRACVVMNQYPHRLPTVESAKGA